MELIDSMPSDATSEKLHRHAYSIEQASIATSLSKSFLRAVWSKSRNSKGRFRKVSE